MKNTFTIFLFIAIAIGFNSCSDDKTTNPDDNSDPTFLNYPLATGNEWKFEEVFVNQNGEIIEKNGNTKVYVVGSEISYQNRLGYEFISTTILTGADSETDTTLLSNDETGLYEYDHNFEDRIRDEYPEASVGWVKLIDYTKDSWTSYESHIDTIIGSTTYYYDVVITGKKVGTKTVTVGEEEFTASVFNIKRTYTNNSSAPPAIDSYEYEMVLIDNVGMHSYREINTTGNGSWGISLTTYNVE